MCVDLNIRRALGGNQAARDGACRAVLVLTIERRRAKPDHRKAPRHTRPSKGAEPNPTIKRRRDKPDHRKAPRQTRPSKGAAPNPTIARRRAKPDHRKAPRQTRPSKGAEPDHRKAPRQTRPSKGAALNPTIKSVTGYLKTNPVTAAYSKPPKQLQLPITFQKQIRSPKAATTNHVTETRQTNPCYRFRNLLKKTLLWGL